MDVTNKEYYGVGCPNIVVNRLTPEIVEQTVNAFAEEDGGYWLKVYTFAGSSALDESIFDQIKAKELEKQKELDAVDAVALKQQAKSILNDSVNQKNLINLVAQYQTENPHLQIKPKRIPGNCLSELKAKTGARIYFQEKDGQMEVVAICDTRNKRQVLQKLKSHYIK